MLTPISIIRKWPLVHGPWNVIPVKKGNQWRKAANRAKTAPVDKT